MRVEWSNKDSLEMPTTTMSNYIKREDAITHITGYLCDEALKIGAKPHEREVFDSIRKTINDIPAADVVLVVRCKDCKWWDGIECQTRDIDVVDDEEYCSYGERKEQNNDNE